MKWDHHSISLLIKANQNYLKLASKSSPFVRKRKKNTFFKVKDLFPTGVFINIIRYERCSL